MRCRVGELGAEQPWRSYFFFPLLFLDLFSLMSLGFFHLSDSFACIEVLSMGKKAKQGKTSMAQHTETLFAIVAEKGWLWGGSKTKAFVHKYV